MLILLMYRQIGSEKYSSRVKSGDTVFRFKCKDSSGWELAKKSNLSCNVNPFPSTVNLMDPKGYKVRTRLNVSVWKLN